MDKILNTTCRIISGITFPLLLPLYAMILAFTATYLQFLPGRPVFTVLLITLGVTVMIPVIAIYALHTVHIITDPRLNSRRDRTIPFAVTAVCYVALSVYMWNINAPAWMPAFMLGAAAVILLMLCINLGWKISGHAAGMGGLTALSAYLMYHGYLIIPGLWLLFALILASGIVCTARLLLGRHTLAQVAAGYALSALVVGLSVLVSGNF